jgi:hypothetical protein
MENMKYLSFPGTCTPQTQNDAKLPRHEFVWNFYSKNYLSPLQNLDYYPIISPSFFLTWTLKL